MSTLPAGATPLQEEAQLASAIPQRIGGLVRLLMIIAALAWLHYTIHGFRPPWQGLTVSDANSGTAMRQALFALGGMIAAYRLITTRTLGLALVHHLPWALFCIFLFASAAWADIPAMSIKRSMIFVLGLILFIALTHASMSPAKFMQRCVIYSAGVTALISLLMMFGLPADCSSIASRPGLAGISNHPNTLSAIMFTGWILALGYKPVSNNEKRFLRINQLAILTALMLTGSVTGILVASVGTICYAVLTARNYRRGIMILLGVTVASAVFLAGPSNVKSMAFDAVERDESMSGRDTLWEDVFLEAQKRPVFGSGFGGFWYEGRGREITGTWNPRQSHLAYLDVYVDLGIVGVIICLGLVAVPLWSATNNRLGPLGSRHRSAMGSMIALGVALLGTYGFSQSFLFRLDQFAMLAFLWCLLLIGNRDLNRLEAEFGDQSE